MVWVRTAPSALRFEYLFLFGGTIWEETVVALLRRCVTGGELWSFRRRWPFLVCCLYLMLADQMWALSSSCHHAFALPSWTLNPLELQVSKHAFFGMSPRSWCFITAIEKGPRQCGSTTVLSSCRRYTPQILEPLSPLVRRHHSPRFLSVDKTQGTVGLGFFFPSLARSLF